MVDNRTHRQWLILMANKTIDKWSRPIKIYRILESFSIYLLELCPKTLRFLELLKVRILSSLDAILAVDWTCETTRHPRCPPFLSNNIRILDYLWKKFGNHEQSNGHWFFLWQFVGIRSFLMYLYVCGQTWTWKGTCVHVLRDFVTIREFVFKYEQSFDLLLDINVCSNLDICSNVQTFASITLIQAYRLSVFSIWPSILYV